MNLNNSVSLIQSTMQLGNISFCDSVGHNIKSDDFKLRIMSNLENLVKFRVIQKHFQEYNVRLNPMLNSNPHCVSLKSNGNPYLLYFTQAQGVNQCIFIDKKIQHGYCSPRMILSHFGFSQKVFDNTLLEGEMVKTNSGKWVFVINDMLSQSNHHLNNVSLIQRLRLIDSMLANDYSPDCMDVCAFQIKKYFQYGQFDDMNALKSRLDYPSRGIVFKPLFLKFKEVLINFDESLIIRAVKSELAATSFDVAENQFLIRKTTFPDVYNIFRSATAESTETACIRDLKISKMMIEVFKDCNSVDFVKFECTFSERFGKWIPVNPVK